jgi:hypothetical protein
MINAYKKLVSNQFESTFCALAECIKRCPEEEWMAPVVKLKFCQVAFHALFFADTYLGPNLISLREQPFHKDNSTVFADYEELEDLEQKVVYEKSFIENYLQHCRDKAARVIENETAESLNRNPGFDWLKFPRAEVHVYNIRHIYHHTAQLALRLKIDCDVEIPWVSSGWKEIPPVS